MKEQGREGESVAVKVSDRWKGGYNGTQSKSKSKSESESRVP